MQIYTQIYHRLIGNKGIEREEIELKTPEKYGLRCWGTKQNKVDNRVGIIYTVMVE